MSPHASPLSAARAPRRYLPATPRHPQESALVALLTGWVAFLPWAFGTMHVWSQCVALAGAIVCFTVAMLPRGESGGVEYRPWQALRVSPLPWLAVALFLYVGIQALNPQWSFARSDTHWWLKKEPAVAWLPAGVAAPFERMNAWRWLVIWGATALAGASVWVGLTRMRSVLQLLVAVVVNASAVAILALLQASSGTRFIFWRFEFATFAGPFGSFVYKNHASAYLLVAYCAAAGLAMWFHARGVSQGQRSTPAPVFLLLLALLAAAIVASLSRFGLVLCLASTVALAARWMHHSPKRVRRLAIALATVALFAGVLAWTAVQRGGAGFLSRLNSAVSVQTDVSFQIRIYAYEATARMLRDHPLFGIGAGGFRHLAPNYLQAAPVITQDPGFGPQGGIRISRMSLNEAHSDWLQLAAELGAVGGLLALAMVAATLASLSARARRLHPIGFSALVGALGAMWFAAFDFPLHNPAFLGTLVVGLVAACRFCDRDTRTPADEKNSFDAASGGHEANPVTS